MAEVLLPGELQLPRMDDSDGEGLGAPRASSSMELEAVAMTKPRRARAGETTRLRPKFKNVRRKNNGN